MLHAEIPLDWDTDCPISCLNDRKASALFGLLSQAINSDFQESVPGGVVFVTLHNKETFVAECHYCNFNASCTAQEKYDFHMKSLVELAVKVGILVKV